MIYKVIDIFEPMVTRFLTLENVETGVRVECFDDSDVCGKYNFKYMKAGESYDCKLLLFGDEAKKGEVFYYKENESFPAIRCIPKRRLKIGHADLVEVDADGETYYVLCCEIKDPSKEFYYISTRKDLIEVDGVPHPDLVRRRGKAAENDDKS